MRHVYNGTDFINYVLCEICTTKLFVICVLYFVRNDKNKDVQSIIMHGDEYQICFCFRFNSWLLLIKQCVTGFIITGLPIGSQLFDNRLFIYFLFLSGVPLSFMSEIAKQIACFKEDRDSPKSMLTHWGLVTSYGDRDLGQYWLR